jgi:hypothetical protein
MNRHVILKPFAVAGVLGACAFAVPTASAMQDLASPDARDARPVAQHQIVSTDLRSPDAQDAVSVAQQPRTVSTDLRSPDARDAVSLAQQPRTVSSDLRSPDAEDAGSNTALQSYATPNVVKVSSSNGFDWGDAGIGAGGMLAVVAIAVGGSLVITRRRSTGSGVSPAAS